ncbi:hypothetical protein PS723_02955 [Pseudomonas fluorescens]|uniref:Uncharacterized protein n=1 Tax=Pseudomonas fluorescens TaxID=294 RepID=A0A5E7DAA7_PSEFL|nr:hypothetical protein PS723_02955 [Pseudomonas fluorescens]
MYAMIHSYRLSPSDDSPIVATDGPQRFVQFIAAVRDPRDGPVPSRQPTR